MLPQFYITMATESEETMKAKEYKNIKDYIKKTKGITICKAKKCNEPLYNNRSTSNKEYCMRCGQKGIMRPTYRDYIQRDISITQQVTYISQLGA